MDEQVARLADRILDRELAAGGREDRPGIADLAARLAVERRLVDQDADLVAGSGFIHPLLAAQNGQDDALRGLGLIAEEFAGPDLFAQGEPGRFGRRLAGADPAAARLLALARHRRLEALDRHLAALATQYVLGQVERKTESVVKAEGDFAGQRLIGPQPFQLFVEQAQAAIESLLEIGFLETQ